MATESDDARLVRIETALTGIDRKGGIVGDLHTLAQTVKDNAEAASESRASIHTRMDGQDATIREAQATATNAKWWSRLPTFVLAAAGLLAAAYQRFLT